MGLRTHSDTDSDPYGSKGHDATGDTDSDPGGSKNSTAGLPADFPGLFARR